MKKFLVQYKEYVVVIIFLGLLCGIGYFVVRPLVKKINAMSDQIQEQSILHESREKRLAELPKLRSQLEFVKGEESKIREVLNKDEAVNLIQEIEKIADDTQNQITIGVNENTQNIPSKPAKSSNNKQEKESIDQKLPSNSFVFMSVKLTGTFNSLENFMKKIENVGYYCDIISITANLKEKPSSNPSVNPFNQSDVPQEEISQPTLLESSLEIAFYIKD